MSDAYFSHDMDARNDPKTTALIHERGMVGYGMWWVTVEMLRAQANYKLPNVPRTWLALSRQMSCEKLQVSPDDVKEFIIACVETYELLQADETNFWSPSLLRRMGRMEDILRKRARAGLASAASRWSGQEQVPSRADQQMINTSSTGVGKGKKRKVKASSVLLEEPENGKVKLRDNVSLLRTDYDRLKNAYGEWFAERCLDKLDAWKGAKGRRTKSDYKAILLWVVGAVNEDIGRGRLARPKEEKRGDTKYGAVGASV